jgi:calcineurin-like phosphoesterase
MIFNIFKKKNSTIPKKNEEAVIINLDAVNLSDEVYQKYDLITLEDKINEVIRPNNLGEYDGDESGPGVTKVYLYAPDAEKLFSSIKPILETYPLCKNAKVIIRNGAPGSVQREELIVQK